MEDKFKKHAMNAIFAQDACNLSGLVFEFADMMKDICEEAHNLGKGTNWKNTHPIVRLMADKINSLALQDSEYDEGACDSLKYSKAYDLVKEMAGE